MISYCLLRWINRHKMNVKLIIFTATVFVCVGANISEDDEKYLKNIFESVDPKDRKQALIHQLYLGYITKYPKSPHFDIPVEDTLKIYDIVLRNFKFPNGPQLKSPICFPSGECVDPDDSGVYPEQ